MPNHYHLIAISKEDDAIPKAMQKIATGYSRAINKAYQKSGHLFEGVY
jgi:REP element-mobilizing transposase RayT